MGKNRGNLVAYGVYTNNQCLSFKWINSEYFIGHTIDMWVYNTRCCTESRRNQNSKNHKVKCVIAHAQHPNLNIKKRMWKKCDQIERDTHRHTTMHYIAQYCIYLVANVKTHFTQMTSNFVFHLLFLFSTVTSHDFF